jgi:protein involved in polysaccharide export with SLBB domain
MKIYDTTLARVTRFVSFSFAMTILLCAQSSLQSLGSTIKPEDKATVLAIAQSVSDGSYRIKRKDMLDIYIDNCSWTEEVDDRGMIEIPFTENGVRAEGKTLGELKADIITAAKKYLKEPKVSIHLHQKSSE